MRLTARACTAALAALTIITTGATSAPADVRTDMAERVRTLAAYPTVPCVSGGPTAADSAAAARLNGVLTGALQNAMTAYRVSCARAVIDAVERRGLGERAAVIAITTTIVESTIMNISEKIDHTSLGLFQQLDSWGTEAQRLNPDWATGAFLGVMQDFYPNGSWRTAPIGEVCQRVQRSAYPERYQPQAADAQRIVDELRRPVPAVVSVYGALSDGRLTYSTIDSRTGDRTKTVVSGASLGFVPKTMATLNFNTLLVTSSSGVLHRVDVITNDKSLTFAAPVFISGGWTHDLLTYDGHGHLYGIAGSTLMSYVVSRPKPSSVHIGQRAVIDSGFTLRTLTATGDDWLLGVSTTGLLRSYRIAPDYTWSGVTLADRWSTFDQLVSPGAGLYYGRTGTGAMYHYLDRDPYDFSGADMQYYGNDPVDTGGWTQTVLSAQPFGT